MVFCFNLLLLFFLPILWPFLFVRAIAKEGPLIRLLLLPPFALLFKWNAIKNKKDLGPME